MTGRPYPAVTSRPSSWPAVALGLGAAALVRQAALAGAPGRLGGNARRRRRGDRLAQQGGQPCPGRLAVHQLAALGLRRDRDHAVGQPGREPGERAAPFPLGQRRRARDVEGKLDPAVRGVDGLAARAGGPGKPLAQLAGRDHQPAVHAKVVGHDSILTYPAQGFGPQAGIASARNGVRPNRDLATQPAGQAVPSKWHAYQACRSRAFLALSAFLALRALLPPVAPPARRAGGSLPDPHRRGGRLLRRRVSLGPSASGALAGAAAEGAPVSGASAAAAAPSAASAANVPPTVPPARARLAPHPRAAAAKYAPAGRQLIYTAQLTVRAASVAAAVSRATSIVTARRRLRLRGERIGRPGAAEPGQRDRDVQDPGRRLRGDAGRRCPAADSAPSSRSRSRRRTSRSRSPTWAAGSPPTRRRSPSSATLLKHAGDVSSLLSVQNQIDSQESDLESMLAQQNALNHETAYATVTLTLVGPKAAAKPPAKSAPPPGLASGLAGGWHALRLTVSWLLAILGAVAPFVAAVAVVGGLAWWGRRRLAAAARSRRPELARVLGERGRPVRRRACGGRCRTGSRPGCAAARPRRAGDASGRRSGGVRRPRTRASTRSR